MRMCRAAGQKEIKGSRALHWSGSDTHPFTKKIMRVRGVSHGTYRRCVPVGLRLPFQTPNLLSLFWILRDRGLYGVVVHLQISGNMYFPFPIKQPVFMLGFHALFFDVYEFSVKKRHGISRTDNSN